MIYAINGLATWSYKFDLPVSTKANRKQAQAHGFATREDAVVAEAVRRADEQAKYIGPPKRVGKNESQDGPKNCKWSGGQKMDAGYRFLLAHDHPRASRDGYVAEHILVAEKALGKFLPEGTIVHHVNQQKSDNRNSNLVICPSTGYHVMIHWRMKKLDAKKCDTVFHAEHSVAT